MNEYCRVCILEKNLDKIPDGVQADTAEAYRKELRTLMEECRTAPSAAEADKRVKALRKRFFGVEEEDFGPVKRYFNALVMEQEPYMERCLAQSDDPLRLAVQYAMTGNLVDFAALDSVDENQLMEGIEKAQQIPVPDEMLRRLEKEIMAAKELLFIVDNCGEIVMDKIMIRLLMRMNPGLHVSVLVRGAPTVNDATREDTEQIGLDEVCTVVPDWRCGDDRPMKEAFDRADVLISKGQANYESWNGCGRNVFYILLCKCRLFRDRFQVEKFAGILTHEDEMPPLEL